MGKHGDGKAADSKVIVSPVKLGKRGKPDKRDAN